MPVLNLSGISRSAACARIPTLIHSTIPRSNIILRIFTFLFYIFLYLMYLCSSLCGRSDIFSHLSHKIT